MANKTGRPVTVVVDSSGRVVLPARFRRELHIEPGDTLLIQRDRLGLRVTKPNPDDLVNAVLREDMEGRTIPLKDLAAKEGIDLATLKERKKDRIGPGMIAEGEAPVGSERKHDCQNSTRYPPPPPLFPHSWHAHGANALG